MALPPQDRALLTRLSGVVGGQDLKLVRRSETTSARPLGHLRIRAHRLAISHHSTWVKAEAPDSLAVAARVREPLQRTPSAPLARTGYTAQAAARPVDLDAFRIRRRDLVGGVIREHAQVG